jgi:hypothetical protein
MAADTYTNITLRGAGRDAVIEAVERTGRAAFVGPGLDGGAVTVYPEGDAGWEAPWLAARLSRELGAVAWLVSVENDDVLAYTLFEAGEPTDRYDSNPGYADTRDMPPAGGDAARLAAAFGLPGDAAEDIDTALRLTPVVPDPTAEIDFEELADYPYLSASDRLRDLCDLLLLPEEAGVVGASFATLDRGVPPADRVSVADLHLARPLRPTPLRRLLLLDVPDTAGADAVAAWLDGEFGDEEAALSPLGAPADVAAKVATALPEADVTTCPRHPSADGPGYALDLDLAPPAGTDALPFARVTVWGPDADGAAVRSRLRRLVEYNGWRLYDADRRAFV